MNSSQSSENDPRDMELWNVARKRAGFRRHLFVYLVVNSFLWVLWSLNATDVESPVPWPLWPSLGWGVGLALNYADAYLFHSENTVEQEYQKLLKKKQNQ